jgi:hypothetical protein
MSIVRVFYSGNVKDYLLVSKRYFLIKDKIKEGGLSCRNCQVIGRYERFDEKIISPNEYYQGHQG